MTVQEAAQRIYDWFVVDGNKPSLGPRNECRYRGPNGTRCAAGVLIPDDLYEEQMEGDPISWVFDKWPAVKEHFGEAASFVDKAQYVHDSAAHASWDDFPGLFLELCEKKGVTIDRRGK